MSKAELRRQMRSRRRALNANEQRQAGEALAVCILTLQPFLNSRRVAFYLANDGEIDPATAMATAREMGKKTYVPMLYPAREQRLLFAEVKDDTRFGRNKFGIHEPRVPAIKWLSAQDLDLVFLPLVAFDDQGRRVGMGGGYYDRTLQYLRQRRCWHRPTLIGLAHHFQQVEAIEAENWDINLSAVVTDRGITTVQDKQC